MARVALHGTRSGEGFADFVRASGTQAAGTVVVADAVTIALGNHGFMGFTLFGAGIIAALYLLARWFRAPLADIAAFIRRPRGAPPVFVPAKTLLVAAIALIPTAIGASILKNHGGGVEDVLNFVSFFGFVTVIAFFALLTVASAVAWVGQEGRK
jgi:hypothetical protein